MSLPRFVTTAASQAPEEPDRPEVCELWGVDYSALIYAAAASCAGAPDDQAILRFAAQRGVPARDIEKRRPLVRSNPPGGARRRSSALREDGVRYVRGEAAEVLPLCPGDAGGAEEAASRMAERGLRVLAVATGSSEREANLTLWGLIGLSAG